MAIKLCNRPKDPALSRQHRMSFVLDRLLQAIQEYANPRKHQGRFGISRLPLLKKKIERYASRLAEMLEGPFCHYCNHTALYCTCHLPSETPNSETTPCTMKPASREL